MIRNPILTGLLITCFAIAGTSQQSEIQGHVVLIKNSLAHSKEQLKKYQWTETTIVLIKGEVKSRREYNCRYLPDGSLQKIALVGASAETIEQGQRGHNAQEKTEELSEYIERAVGLVKMYVPPDPQKIQASTTEGKASLMTIEPGERVRLRFQNYQMPGDQLAIDVDRTNDRILSAAVTTYLDDPKEVVALIIQFDLLPDGTTYASAINLNVPDKTLAVQIVNSDYHAGTN